MTRGFSRSAASDEVMNDRDMAMLIEAHLATQADPLTRFVASLPVEMRHYAEETIRLRDEFVSNAQRMLISTNPREAANHAEWIARHSHEVAYRWVGLMQSVRRWCELECTAIYRIEVPGQ